MIRRHIDIFISVIKGIIDSNSGVNFDPQFNTIVTIVTSTADAIVARDLKFTLDCAGLL